LLITTDFCNCLSKLLHSAPGIFVSSGTELNKNIWTVGVISCPWAQEIGNYLCASLLCWHCGCFFCW